MNKMILPKVTVDDLFCRTYGGFVSRIDTIEIDKIIEFKNHPFKVNEDEEMD